MNVDINATVSSQYIVDVLTDLVKIANKVISTSHIIGIIHNLLTKITHKIENNAAQ
jgi:hypothetical protein